MLQSTVSGPILIDVGGVCHKRTTFFMCVSRPVSTLISASGEKNKKNSNEHRTTGQIRVSDCPRLSQRETDCLTQNNSILETNTENKLVTCSFKVVPVANRFSTESRSRVDLRPTSSGSAKPKTTREGKTLLDALPSYLVATC